MFRRTHSQAIRYASLLAGVSLVALGAPAGFSAAQAGPVGLATRCSNSQNGNENRVDNQPFQFEHGSLVVSSSTYDPTQGAVASLSIGTTLAGSATKTSKAVANNDYVHVWNNASVDGSFG
jgi:hypothetical protein